MSNIQRICERCHQAGSLDARFCVHCGYDSQAELSAQQPNLPMVLGKAALPLLAGAASLALRAAWKLLQNRLAVDAVRNATNFGTTTKTVKTELAPLPANQTLPTRARRTIRIRSAWTVGDGKGGWQQGASEHTIEIDE